MVRYISSSSLIGSHHWNDATHGQEHVCPLCQGLYTVMLFFASPPQAIHAGGQDAWWPRGQTGRCRCGIYWSEAPVFTQINAAQAAQSQ